MPDDADDDHESRIESLTIRRAFGERRIAFGSMDLPLRMASVATLVGLLGAAVLIWSRGAEVPQVSLGVVAGEQVTLALPLFIATLVLLSVGFGFLVAGALFARRAVAVIGLVCLTVLIAWTTGVLGIGGYSIPLPDWAGWASRGVLGGVVVVGAVALILRHGRPGDAVEDRRLRIATTMAVVALFGGYFLILWVASPVSNGLTLFPQSINLLMTDVAILATPMLLIAAVDFGEWGELAGQRLVSLPMQRRTGGSRRWSYLVAAALGCGALVYGTVLAGGTPGDRLWQVAQGGLLLAILLAVLLAVVRGRSNARGAGPRTPAFAALFCVCAVVTWVGGAGVAAVSGALAAPPQPQVSAHGDFTPTANVHTITGITGFTALVPVGWDTQWDQANNIDRITNVFPDKTSVVMLALTAESGTVQQVAAADATLLGAPTRDGSWQEQQVSPHGGGMGTIWLSAGDGGKRVFYGVAEGKSARSALTTLQAIVRTYRPSGQAPATLAEILAANGTAAEADAQSQRSADGVQVLGAAFALLTAVVALLALVAFGRRWSPPWRLAVMVYVSVAALTVVASSDSVGRLLFGAGWPALTVGGLTAAAGLAGLAALAVAARSRAGWAERVPAAVAGVLGTVIVLGIVHQLYDVALAAAEVPQWAAILILIAVGWDIMMSGETMTNLSTRTFPRSTRVVAFYGYALVLAAAMVYYSGQLSVATGHAITEPFFDPESITRSALFRIGFPVLLLLGLLRVVGPSRARPVPLGPDHDAVTEGPALAPTPNAG